MGAVAKGEAPDLTLSIVGQNESDASNRFAPGATFVSRIDANFCEFRTGAAGSRL
jgi:hypothetical protein